MHELVSLSDRTQVIEARTGIKVPCFVSELLPINMGEAGKMAIDLGIDESFLSGFSDPRRTEFFAQIVGLKFCRSIGTTPDLVYQLPKERLRPKTAAEIFDTFSDVSRNFDAISAQEKRRREKRDNAILQLEKDLLRKKGIDVPDFSSLLEYCAWIPEHNGHNEQLRRWNVEYPPAIWSPLRSQEVYWDLLDYYYQFIEGAKKSPDPLNDWEDHLMRRRKDIDQRFWDIDARGKEDISYYSMLLIYGGGLRTQPSRIRYNDILITHTTSLETAQRIVQEGYLNADRIAFSSGRVVARGFSQPQVTFIFPRNLLTDVYSILPLIEPMESHEKELRAFEPISLSFCVGAVPVTKDIFPDNLGRGTGTQSLGEKTIIKWGEQYAETGQILTIQEKVDIRKIAEGIL